MRGGRGGSRKAGGPGVVAAHKRHARGCGPTQGLGAKGTRGERTRNMLYMVVTLEVSKLSSWLKAVATCRVEGRACEAGGRGASREAAGPGVVAARQAAACTAVARPKAWGPRARRGAHVEHPAHGRDAGGVEAQLLIEGRRGLPS